ncbi:OmpL47-type beta-barrel domain-containing protein [Bdellovibrio sp. HCB209]|uniref:OmpL47-type beta-barrel domain-containing protein n=1 Tax=Bdellovibrio sp. HCB209 TaxID=3394354 RepID=UPI0039B5972C
MNNRTFRAWSSVLIVGVLLVGYQNCAENVNFGLSQDELASQQAGMGANSILLNGGSPYTTDSAVTVNIVSQNATDVYISNDSSCEKGGAWEPLVSTKKWKLQSPNALNNVYAKFKKTTQLTVFYSECLPASITHDDIAPKVSIVQKPNAMVASPKATFGMRIDDDLSGLDHFECLLVGEASFTNCGDMKQYNSAPEGQNRFQVRAVDRAGNRSATVEYAWLVDTTAPTVEITNKPAAVSPSSQAVFNFTGADTGSGLASFQCAIDGGNFVACSSPSVYSNLIEGTHVFSVQAIDKVGNVSAPLSYTWKSQGNATNDFSIIGITGGNDTIKDNYLGSILQPTIHWTASAGAVGYRVLVAANADGSGVVCPEAPASGTSLAMSSCTLQDGKTYYARVAAYTSTGVIKIAPTYQFLVDITAPVITLAAPTISEDQKVAVFSPFGIVDNISGIDTASCVRTFGGTSQSVANCQSLTKITFSDLVTGDHVLTVTAKDKAGNSASKVVNFTSKKIVCDPFSASGISCRQGWKGNIFYYPGTSEGWKTLSPYFSEGTDAGVILYMSNIFVPTRSFGNGFPTTDGELVKKKAADGGANLVEWFGIRLDTILKLNTTDSAGYYQFALISDDGSKLYIAPAKGGSYSTIIDNDSAHSTKMKCSSTAIYMDSKSRMPAKLDYFQGPRVEIALNLMYRKVSSASPDVSAPCEANEGGKFYGSVDNTSGNYAGSSYQKALDAGWKQMSTDNFLLDETVGK